MAKIISGIAISKEIRAELKEQIAEWVAKGNRAPHLTAVLIGDDPASHTYVNNKIKVTHLFSKIFSNIFNFVVLLSYQFRRLTMSLCFFFTHSICTFPTYTGRC